MATTLRIRPATPADKAIVAEFNSALAFETEGKILDHATVTAGVLETLVNPQRGRYFVCMDESTGEVCGQLMHTREWSDWRNGEIWWLQSVYVVPSARGKGVFKLLYEYLEQLAKSTADVVGLRLYVEQGNVNAQEAYVRLGFKNAQYVVFENLWTQGDRWAKTS